MHPHSIIKCRACWTYYGQLGLTERILDMEEAEDQPIASVDDFIRHFERNINRQAVRERWSEPPAHLAHILEPVLN